MSLSESLMINPTGGTNFWLLKTEPADYAYADLERDGATVWDGVASNAALIHAYPRAVRPGDRR